MLNKSHLGLNYLSNNTKSGHRLDILVNPENSLGEWARKAAGQGFFKMTLLVRKFWVEPRTTASAVTLHPIAVYETAIVRRVDRGSGLISSDYCAAVGVHC